MKKLLFVCTGNTCRSPMAQAMMDKLISECDEVRRCWRVESAGTSAWEGAGMSDNARIALEELDVSPGGHASRPLTPRLLAECELILAMEARHVGEVLAIYPQAAGRVYTLGEYAANRPGQDICDPFGRPVNAYVSCAQEIRRSLLQVLERLKAQCEQ